MEVYNIYIRWDGIHSTIKKLAKDIKNIEVCEDKLVEIKHGEVSTKILGRDVNEHYDIKITAEMTIPELREFIQKLRKIKGLEDPEGAIIVKPVETIFPKGTIY